MIPDLPESTGSKRVRKAGRTWKTRAVIGGVAGLTARAPVLAGRRVARHVEVLTVLARVCWLAGTLVGPDFVGAAPAVLADGRTDVALIHVLLAVGPVEARCALADVMGFKRNTLPSVGAGIRGTGICLLAGLTWGANKDGWGWRLQLTRGKQMPPRGFLC